MLSTNLLGQKTTQNKTGDCVVWEHATHIPKTLAGIFPTYAHHRTIEQNLVEGTSSVIRRPGSKDREIELSLTINEHYLEIADIDTLA